MSSIALALGTAQFGMKYGIAGRGAAVPPAEVRSILAAAWEFGIRMIDTAPGYGDIEERLAALAQGYTFEFVSKIPALPKHGAPNEISAFVSATIQRTRSRLGPGLRAILFHRGEDLLAPHAEIAWRSAAECLDGTGIALGVSSYSPAEAISVRATFPIAVAQVPGNAFDQRLTSAPQLKGVTVHLRSAFLQGLLLMPAADAAKRLPVARAAVDAWAAWCNEREIEPLQAALSLAKSMPAQYCLVGVDRLTQLEQIVASWESAQPLEAPRLAIGDRRVIDPRCWSNSEN